MRTTIDLPDDLFREVKATAAREGAKMKDLVARILREGLRRRITPPHTSRSAPPFLPRSGRRMKVLTGARLNRILDAEDARGRRR